MFVPALKTTSRLCLPVPQASFTSPTVRPAAIDMACTLDRLADLHQSEGRTAHADRLAHAALELRARVTGAQA